MEKIHGIDFQPIEIDRRGTLKGGADELAAHVKANGISDVVLMCHGFRNDENDARRLYTRFLETFTANRTHASLNAKLAGRTFAVGGVFWPSMVFPEPDDSDGAGLAMAESPAADRARLESIKSGVDAPAATKIDGLLARVGQAPVDPAARREMAAILLDIVRDLPVDDANEMHGALAHVTPDELCDALMAGTVTVTAPGGGAIGTRMPTPGGGAAVAAAGQGAGPVGKVVGFVPTFLNLTTFLLMFHRCGTVGEKGMSQVVRKVKAAANARIHLVGHSLGGRAVTACAKALLDAPPIQADTMMLLEAAYSHFGLSAAATASSPIQHPRGHFRDVIEKKAVKGPILATHSERDLVVALAYTPMAAISLNNSRGMNARGIGDETSPFGGMGRNGVLDAPEAERLDLNDAGVAYTFAADRIHNLNGSRKVNGVSIIDSHGDVTSPAITWAFASLVASV